MDSQRFRLLYAETTVYELEATRLGATPQNKTHNDIIPKQRKTSSPHPYSYTCNWCLRAKVRHRTLFHSTLEASTSCLSFMKAAALYRKYVLNKQRIVAAVLKDS